MYNNKANKRIKKKKTYLQFTNWVIQCNHSLNKQITGLNISIIKLQYKISELISFSEGKKHTFYIMQKCV